MKTHTAEINGKEITFYPLPVSILFECNKLGSSVSSLVANLFADTSRDVETEETTVPVDLSKEGEDKVFQNWNKVSQPVSPSMASLRISQKKEGIESLFEILTGAEARLFLSRVITKSAKEEDLDAKTLMDEMDIETFAEMLKGVKEANLGVFEKLGKWLRLLAPEQVADKVKEKIDTAIGMTMS